MRRVKCGIGSGRLAGAFVAAAALTLVAGAPAPAANVVNYSGIELDDYAYDSSKGYLYSEYKPDYNKATLTNGSSWAAADANMTADVSFHGTGQVTPSMSSFFDISVDLTGKDSATRKTNGYGNVYGYDYYYASFTLSEPMNYGLAYTLTSSAQISGATRTNYPYAFHEGWLELYQYNPSFQYIAYDYSYTQKYSYFGSSSSYSTGPKVGSQSGTLLPGTYYLFAESYDYDYVQNSGASASGSSGVELTMTFAPVAPEPASLTLLGMGGLGLLGYGWRRRKTVVA